MTWLDVIMIVALLWGGWRGHRRGLAREAAYVGGAIAGVAVAVRAAPAIATVVQREYGWSEMVAFPIAFLVIALGIATIGVLVAPSLNRGISRLRGGTWLNRWGGALIGGLKYALFLLVILVVVTQLPWTAARQAIESSSVAIRLLSYGESVYASFQGIIPMR